MEVGREAYKTLRIATEELQVNSVYTFGQMKSDTLDELHGAICNETLNKDRLISF